MTASTANMVHMPVCVCILTIILFVLNILHVRMMFVCYLLILDDDLEFFAKQAVSVLSFLIALIVVQEMVESTYAYMCLHSYNNTICTEYFGLFWRGSVGLVWLCCVIWFGSVVLFWRGSVGLVWLGCVGLVWCGSVIWFGVVRLFGLARFGWFGLVGLCYLVWFGCVVLAWFGWFGLTGLCYLVWFGCVVLAWFGWFGLF